ncbi:hypothetical protein KEJ37_05315 [Candidatus Bathyarchaeota archaeon]|nr:hypothetical protein [Candidatus Bathyarchaeota archaeon]
MPKPKIGKGSAIISSPREEKEYQEWLEEQRQEKKAEEAEEIEGKEVKSPIPMEPQLSDDKIAEERAKMFHEMAKLKVSKVALKEDE